MFGLSFYVFSLFLSYSDYKRYLVPNNMLLALFVFMLSYGFLENQLNIYSTITPLFVLFALILLIVVFPKMKFGGGDIKYMVLVALFLEPLQFAYFLIITGVLQFFTMVYVQLLKKEVKTAMVPVMFMSVFITQLMFSYEVIRI